MGLGVKDTAAHRIIRQVTDHTWGPDEKLDDTEVVRVCRSFRDLGGTWEALMAGDVDEIAKLEAAIDALVQGRNLRTMASRVAFGAR